MERVSAGAAPQPSLPGVAACGVAAHLVLGNLLIAAGTLVLSASGTLAGRLGKDTAFLLTLLVGIVVLFAGFLVASAHAASAGRRCTPWSHQRAA